MAPSRAQMSSQPLTLYVEGVHLYDDWHNMTGIGIHSADAVYALNVGEGVPGSSQTARRAELWVRARRSGREVLIADESSSPGHHESYGHGA